MARTEKLPDGAQQDDPADDSAAHESPERAPEGSLWGMQEDVDFFLPPALPLDPLEYLSVNGEGPEQALRERFGLPAEAEPARPDPPDDDVERA